MGKDTRDISQRHAIWLLNLEKATGLDIEKGLQSLILDRPFILWFFNKYVRKFYILCIIVPGG